MGRWCGPATARAGWVGRRDYGSSGRATGSRLGGGGGLCAGADGEGAEAIGNDPGTAAGVEEERGGAIAANRPGCTGAEETGEVGGGVSSADRGVGGPLHRGPGGDAGGGREWFSATDGGAGEEQLRGKTQEGIGGCGAVQQ